MPSVTSCLSGARKDGAREMSGPPRDSGVVENVLDLNKVVEKYAWSVFERTATKSQKKLKRKNAKSGPHIDIKVNWSNVRFREETSWKDLVDTELSDDVIDNGSSAVQHEVCENAISGIPNTSMFFQTTFQNDTESEQEFCMKTDKTTKSSVMVTLQTGYTAGNKCGITLQCPSKILAANAGFHSEYKLANVKGQTVEEELKWGGECQIKVKAQSVAEVSIGIREKKQKGDFTILTHVTGDVHVNFTNIRDNHSLVMFTWHDIARVLEEYGKEEPNHKMAYFENKDGVDYIKTTGNCKFLYGIKQEVKVHQTALPTHI